MTSIIEHHWAVYVYLTWILIVSGIILYQRRSERRTAAIAGRLHRQEARAALLKMRPPLSTPAASQARQPATKRKPALEMPRPMGREAVAWENIAYSI